jgi:hypothetical protein
VWFIAFKRVYYLYNTQHNFEVVDDPDATGKRPDSYFQELYARILPESDERPPPSIQLVQKCFNAQRFSANPKPIPLAFFSSKHAYKEKRYDVILRNVFITDMDHEPIILGREDEFVMDIRIAYGDFDFHPDSGISFGNKKVLPANLKQIASPLKLLKGD